MMHVPCLHHPRHPLTGIAVALLLASCGQNATPTATPGSGATPPGGAAAPTASALQLLSADATSSTSIHLVFSGAVGTGSTDARTYRLTDASGAPLEVLAAYLADDGQSVDLATRVQAPTAYTLVLDGVQSPSGQPVVGKKTVSGSAASAPVLGDVVPLGPSEVLLRFEDPVSGLPATLGQRALRAAAFRFSPAVEFKSARLSQDRSSVVVTTAGLSADSSYTVSALSVLATAGAGPATLVDPQHNQGTFIALALRDTVKPVIKRMMALSSTSVQLIFSEPVSANAADLSTYLIKDATGAVLPVTGADLSEFRTSVTLTTTPQAIGATYTLTPGDLTDSAGNPLDSAAGKSVLSFAASSGQPGRADTTPLRVAGATSTGNGTVLVTFSEAVRGGTASAENPAHYHVTGLEQLAAAQPAPAAAPSLPTPQSAALSIISAVLQPDGTSVLLTTRAQSDIKYELQVTGVTDLAGNQIAAPERGVDPGKASFTGTPVSGYGKDTDGDGLSDATEQRGWLVSVVRLDGGKRQYEVTSDPTLADTDGDGLDDSDELANLTDPRVADTDGDKITDSDEYNLVYSSPTNADTDSDTLSDGSEYTLYASSPLLADTDGDQIRDDAEVLTSLRNPLIADLPAPRISVDGVDLQLDVNFTATSDTGTRQLDSKTAQTTLTQGTSNSTERSDTTTSEWFANQSVGASFQETIGDEFKAYPKVTFSQSVTSDTGTSGSAGTSFTTASVRNAQQEYADSLTTDKEVSANDSVTRSVSGASLSVGVTIESQSNVAFTMTNLELTAFMPDPFAPGKLIPIATLQPEGAVASGGVTLGPGSPSRGPIRFKAVQIYASLAEKLMQDPSGLVFKISNYTLSDETRRDLAYVSQGVKERTAEVFIDYGGALPFERSNVATFSNYGADSKPTGITMQRVMEGILGLKHYDQSQDAGLSGTALHNSYSTFMDDGVEKLARVREKTFGSLSEPKRWFVTINNNGSNIGFRDTIVKAGDKVRLAYTEDLDRDGLTRAEEDLYGSSDTTVDTDGDGVSDIEEVYGPADASGRRSPRTILRDDGTTQALISNPAAADTDGDGLTDCQELSIVIGTTRVNGQTITNYRCPIAVQARLLIYGMPLDPSNPDTDGDGISDRTELFGYAVKSYIKTGQPLTAYSDPRKADSDGDGTPDRLEYRLGTNPAVADRDLVLDDDRDGLSNYQEVQGWTVTAQTANGPVTKTVTSDPLSADGDNDGLNDAQEKVALTDPRSADTDGDTLKDGAEVKLSTLPLRWDTDGDQLSDGAEVNSTMLVHVKSAAGTASIPDYVAKFNPLLPDADQDGLTDDREMKAGTDPNLRDTDQDGADDRFEAVTSHNISGASPQGTDPLLKDKLLLVKLESADVVGDCDPLAGDSNGEFSGELLIQSGTHTPTHLLYLKLDGQDGLLDHTREGTSYTFNDTKVYEYVTEDREFRFLSKGLQELDTGNANDPLNQLNDVKAYADVKTGNYTVDAVAADASDSSCKVTFHYSITLRQN
ncbi:binary toxin-like calcium binding domain-containing protein [Deinococcus sonorensis]|uniref:Binary toxin-like calcium binding domain-containing protein n=2 Tax=Deinococcus sonorensis TaxID=309891 RepID=A0AAU7U646_9DEIO